MSSEKYFDVSKETLRELAQTFLETKKMGRSIENAADSLRPLTEDENVTAKLVSLAYFGNSAAALANELYHLIAREAMTT